jgi:hypothetical protein
VPKQFEYWSQIKKIAEENPGLPFSVIHDILIADQEEAIDEDEAKLLILGPHGTYAGHRGSASILCRGTAGAVHERGRAAGRSGG